MWVRQATQGMAPDPFRYAGMMRTGFAGLCIVLWLGAGCHENPGSDAPAAAAPTPGPDIAALEQKRDVDGLIEALSHSKARVDAAEALARLGPVVIERLLPLFRDRDPLTVRAAVMAVGGMAPNITAAVPELMNVVRDHRAVSVRLEAIRALGGAEFRAARAVGVLEPLLSDRTLGKPAQDALEKIAPARDWKGLRREVIMRAWTKAPPP